MLRPVAASDRRLSERVYEGRAVDEARVSLVDCTNLRRIDDDTTRKACAHIRPRLSRLDASLYIGATGFQVPYKSLIRLRAAYMPDAARPELVSEARRTPGFDITSGISTHDQLFAFARLFGPYLTGPRPAFCCNAHHIRF
jgi:hypothetical protein